MDDLERDRAIASRLMGSTVRVTAGPSLGSGFRVNDLVLTAAHVVSDSPDDILVWAGAAQNRVPAAIGAVNEEWDLCALQLQTIEPFAKVSRFEVESHDRAATGDPLWTSGFPLGLKIPVIRRGWISSYIMEGALPLLAIDVPTFPGCSGGPVLDNGGAAIGLITRAFLTPNLPLDLGLAVDIRRLGIAHDREWFG